MKGDPGQFVAFILKGRVFHSLNEPTGREVIVDTSEQGSLVGEMALLGAIHHHDATLSRDCQLALLYARHFAPLQANPPFMQKVQRLLGERLNCLSQFVESACLFRLEVRLARHLLRLMQQHGQTRADGIYVPMRMSQSTLAAMLNASRPRLNAQLHCWEREGLIAHERHAITVLHPQRLHQLAEVTIKNIQKEM